MTTVVEPSIMPMRATMTAAPRCLLLTGTAPGEPGVGGVILKDIIEQTGTERWECCWLAPKHGPQQPFWNAVRTTVIKRQFETGYRPVRGLAGEMISAVALRLSRAGMIAHARKMVAERCREWQPQFIVAVLESPAVIETVRQIQQTTSIPIRCIVWDDVDLFCRQANFDRWTRHRIEVAFGDALRNSARVAVICENMQREYQRRYGIDSTVIRHGVAPDVSASQREETVPRSEYRIGFAGSNTAPDCLRALIGGLDEIGWRIDGREIVLRMLGARYLLDSRKPQRIEYFGWRTVEETRARLAECDLLYLPQSFTPENRAFSELSFPTKLSTYLAARQPILLHAPNYASLTGFWQRYPLGPAVGSLTSSAVVDGVRAIVQAGRPQRDEWVATGKSAIGHAIGPQPFATAVQEFLS